MGGAAFQAAMPAFQRACLLNPPRRHAGSKAVVAGWKPAPRTLAVPVRSAENFADNSGWINPHQRFVAALVRESILPVIDTQQVLDSGMDIAVTHFEILHGRVAQVVGLTEIESALHSRARHPHTESVRIVVAAGLRVLG